MDLHEINFFKLFYKVFDSPNAEETALEIASKTMPESAAKFREMRRRLDENNRKLKAKLDEAEKLPDPDPQNFADRIAWLNRERAADSYLWDVSRAEGITKLEYFIYEPEFQGKRVEATPSNRDLLIWLKSRREDVLAYLYDESQFCKEFFLEHCKEKPAATLLLLPFIESDHKMIVFFGKKFHTTFANVDAYTGLHYAYEFFRRK